MPRPLKDEFESFTDLLAQIKAYAKEVGFSVYNVVVDQQSLPLMTEQVLLPIRTVKRIICTKNHSFKKVPENATPNIHNGQAASAQDDDCAIVEVVDAQAV